MSGLLMRPFTWPLACMEFAGRVHPALARLRRTDNFTGFPGSVSLTVAPYLSIDLPASLTASSPGQLYAVCGRPYGRKRFFESLSARVQVLPCVRPTCAAFHMPLACMEFAGRVQSGFARSRRSDITLVFLTPSH